MGGGGKGGGGGGKTQPSVYEQALARIANEMYDTTKGIRQTSLDQLSGVLGGNYNVQKLPGYAPLYSTLRSGMEDQYNVAKENVTNSLPRGGALTSALSDLEGNRANQVGSLSAQISGPIIQDMMNKAYGTAWQTPAQATQGLGAASSSFANRYASDNALQGSNNGILSGGMSGIGQGIGYVAANACPFCFIFATAGEDMNPVVRQYRDEHQTTKNRRGYCVMADRIVPAMERSRLVLEAVRWMMVKPLIAYGRWFYGHSKWGWIMAPIKIGWFKVWDFLGDRPVYRRKVTGEVV